MTIHSKSPISRRHFLKFGSVIAGIAVFTQPLLRQKIWASPLSSPRKNSWIISVNQKKLPSEANTVIGLPGSLMKLLATAILLENQLIQVDTVFECRGLTDSKLTNGKALHCAHTHGKVTLIDALAVSCNNYFAHAIQPITTQQFQNMWQFFFPNRSLKPLPTHNTLPSYLLGYSNSVALSAAEILHWMQNIASKGKSRTKNLKPYTWHVLHQGMRSAARWGTGKKVDPSDKHRLAIKTGTTRQGNHYQSWIAGFFPFDDPQMVFCCRGIHGTSEESAVPLLQKALK